MDKQMALDVISKLPDNISVEDMVEALYLRINIGKRLDNYEKNKGISHKDLKKEISQWI